MIVGKIGTPELVLIFFQFVLPIIVVAAIFVIAYFVIRNAVAAGILRAEKLRKQNRNSCDM